MPPRPRQDKSRVRTPKAGASTGTGSRRTLLLISGGAIGLVVIVVVAVLAFGGGGGGNSGADATSLLQAAGCKVTNEPAVVQAGHIVQNPNGTSPKWKTVPPTSGPHYAVPVVWGSYSEPVGQAALVHNLEHGGVFILYGRNVADGTIEELRSFYDSDPPGLVLAPRPSLGNKIALGAWTAPESGAYERATAHLALCPGFDEDAVAAFVDAYRGKGPERFRMQDLVPGST